MLFWLNWFQRTAHDKSLRDWVAVILVFAICCSRSQSLILDFAGTSLDVPLCIHRTFVDILRSGRALLWQDKLAISLTCACTCMFVYTICNAHVHIVAYVRHARMAQSHRLLWTRNHCQSVFSQTEPLQSHYEVGNRSYGSSSISKCDACDHHHRDKWITP